MKTDKLIRLEENIKILKDIRENYTLDDIISDKVDEWGLRYGLFESIQIIIDLSCHIVSEKNLGTPKNYSDCITLLVSNKYLSKNLGEKITKMVGLRNLLIHEYGIVEAKKLFEFLDNINDLIEFINSVKKTL